MTRLSKAPLFGLRLRSALRPAGLLLALAGFTSGVPASPGLPTVPGATGALHAQQAVGVRTVEVSSDPLRPDEGMVVSAHGLASEAGARVLAAGGNAVDAAIATGFALAVTHPVAGNIGGGGFMVVRYPDGRTTAFDFREKAPMAAHPGMFLDEAGDYSAEIHHRSHVAVGVPGTVAGFALAHERLGTLPWADLVRPSVDMARDGFEVTPGLARSLEGGLRSMAPYPASVAAFSKDGVPYQPGETLVQADLAGTLERIMGLGRDGFYQGKTARLLAEEMRREGGLITEADLAAYQAVERSPVRGQFRGYDIISMPPPSSGGVALVQMLNILEGYDLASMGHNSAEIIHYLVEAMRRAYRDRAQYLGDPDFVSVPVDELTDKAYAAELRGGILPDRASVSAISDLDLPEESPETTHYSVVDASGMAVSVTYTLEAGYGSKIVVPGAGFLLNNEMGDFNAEPGRTTETGLIGTEANLAMPEKRMLSSMTPSIVARDGDLVAVVGSPGGRTIINTVLQVILNMTEFGMPVDQAVEAGRLHHQWLPDRVRIEAGAIDEATRQALEAMGYQISEVRSQGRAHAIMIDPATGERVGAPDPRDADGGAAGHDG
jgi:gamma-glutamyltranspeptidase/glutathione hydrolase